MPTARPGQFDADFIAQARRFAEEQRRGGRTWAELGKELGVRAETLRRWCVGRERAGAMRAIEIVAAEPTSVALSVVSPGGLRVEGLSVHDVIAVLRALG